MEYCANAVAERMGARNVTKETKRRMVVRIGPMGVESLGRRLHHTRWVGRHRICSGNFGKDDSKVGAIWGVVVQAVVVEGALWWLRWGRRRRNRCAWIPR